MSASSWPDMSPLARDRMIPIEKKLVRTTAVPASEAERRAARWVTQVSATAASRATAAAAGTIRSMPP